MGQARKLSWFEWACAALMLAGFLARLGSFVYRVCTYDSSEMVQMGSSFVRAHEFFMPYATGPEYSHHFPPLFPLYLAAFFGVLGVHFWVIQLAVLLAGGGFIAIAFACTRDLYGRSRAFAVAALAGTLPLLITQDQVLYSESIVAALFTLTIWAILKSLDKPPFIVLAGLFAGLSFLAKASMGPFFVLAGFAGFAWRFYYVRWRIFLDKWYLFGAAIFGALVLTWSARNIARFGWPNYETQQHATIAFQQMWASPNWPSILARQSLFMLALVLVFMLPWLPQIKRSLKHVRDQRVSALWMAFVTPAIVAVFFVTAFSIAEGYGTVINETTMRYVTAPFVPLMWLALREADLDPQPPLAAPKSAARMHASLFFAGIGVLAVTIAFDPTYLILTRARVLFVYAMIGLGCLLLAASTGFIYVRKTERDGARDKATPDPKAIRALGWGALALVFVYYAATFYSFYVTVFLIPIAAAAFVRDLRFKVVAIAALFLAGGLVGTSPHGPLDDLAQVVNEAAPQGATIGAFHNEQLRWIQPWLRDDLQLMPGPDNATIIISSNWLPSDAAPPPGYHVAGHVALPIAMGPGTWLQHHFLEPVFGDPVELPVGDAWVYAANATGAPT